VEILKGFHWFRKKVGATLKITFTLQISINSWQFVVLSCSNGIKTSRIDPRKVLDMALIPECSDETNSKIEGFPRPKKTSEP